ncbi:MULTISPECIES: amidase domain-containing protein [unclassified Virgibacillus]|uniref:amidase domain-containing protein n=1 Tax=unclassified Virgibacillus TaxID=2620237 RepID=UPI0024DEEA65|nr:amidase domain-containing protein [Virgibacillus sp. LDC-1]
MEQIKQIWLDMFANNETRMEWWEKKQKLFEKREARIVRIRGSGQVFHTVKQKKREDISYLFHVVYLIKQGDFFYLEEQITPYRAILEDGALLHHMEITEDRKQTAKVDLNAEKLLRSDKDEQSRFAYNRLAAVQYAERWWNSYNPEYRSFDVDCTNYVSQCLAAGGAPMWGAPNRGTGWWYNNNSWSYSWAVAHSLRWYLSGAKKGLKGTAVDRPEELIPGDVICYDFQGDDQWEHNTIVVAKDANGMPLVNAHTNNSRQRYWAYEDSAAWTPNIKYKFFRIGE